MADNRRSIWMDDKSWTAAQQRAWEEKTSISALLRALVHGDGPAANLTSAEIEAARAEMKANAEPPKTSETLDPALEELHHRMLGQISARAFENAPTYLKAYAKSDYFRKWAESVK